MAEMRLLERAGVVKVGWIIILIVIFMSSIGYWHFCKIDSDPILNISTNKKAPGFTLENSQGKQVKLDDFKGTVVVLHLWASWCPPCVEEIGVWASALREAAEKSNLRLIAVSVDEKWADANKIFPEKLHQGISVLLDPKSKISEEYGTYQFPETYLINDNLEIIYKWVGPQEWSFELIRQVATKKGVNIITQSKSP